MSADRCDLTWADIELTVPPRRQTCPNCRERVEVLPDGRLAYHYRMPGTGDTCPPHDTTERLR